MCPAHPCLLSLMFLIISVTSLYFWIQFVLFLSLRVVPSMILSIFLWVVTSFSSWVSLSDQVSQPYIITGSIYSLNAFLFSLIGTFLSRIILSSLPNALYPCQILRFYFLYLVMALSHHLREIGVSVDLLDLLSIDNHIILVDILVTHYFSLPRRISRPTGLPMPWISCSISFSLEVELATRTILSAKIRWDKYSPSILTPLFSQLILLTVAHCRHDVKSLGEMLSSCLAPLSSLIFKAKI